MNTLAKTLLQKLLIKPGGRVRFINAPQGYLDLLGELPDGVQVLGRGRVQLDVVQLFVRNNAELNRRAASAMHAVRPEGVLWVCYPKKSSKVESDLSSRHGWEVFYDAGWDSVAICSIDETWSGLKFARTTQKQ